MSFFTARSLDAGFGCPRASAAEPTDGGANVAAPAAAGLFWPEGPRGREIRRPAGIPSPRRTRLLARVLRLRPRLRRRGRLLGRRRRDGRLRAGRGGRRRGWL